MFHHYAIYVEPQYNWRKLTSKNTILFYTVHPQVWPTLTHIQPIITPHAHLTLPTVQLQAVHIKYFLGLETWSAPYFHGYTSKQILFMWPASIVAEYALEIWICVNAYHLNGKSTSTCSIYRCRWYVWRLEGEVLLYAPFLHSFGFMALTVAPRQRPIYDWRMNTNGLTLTILTFTHLVCTARLTLWTLG